MLSIARSRIEAALAPLVGMQLWASNRAADMQTFQFGGKRTRVLQVGPRKGQQSVVGEFALHLQCAWRVMGPTGIIVGSADMFRRRSDQPESQDWDWSAVGANRRDEAIAAWLDSRTYVVVAVHVDDAFGFTVVLSDGHSLAVFPDGSGDDERWRLLSPGDEAPHFVVTGAGIED